MKVEVSATKIELDGVVTNYLLSGSVMADDGVAVLKLLDQHVGPAKTALIQDGVITLEEVVNDWGIALLDEHKREVAINASVASEAASNREVTDAEVARTKFKALETSNEHIINVFDDSEKQARLNHAASEKNAEQDAMNIGTEFEPTVFITTPDTAEVSKARKDLANLQAM